MFEKVKKKKGKRREKKGDEEVRENFCVQDIVDNGDFDYDYVVFYS